MLTNQVGIDVRMGLHTGIGRYIRGIVRHLNPRHPKLSYRLYGYRQNKTSFPGQFDYSVVDAPIYGLKEQLISSFLRDCDVLHSPHYNAPLARRKKLVVTIHDLIHLHFAQDLSFAARSYACALLPLITRRADAIITVSEFVKNDIVHTLKVRPEKIHVIHHGIEPDFTIKDKKSYSIEKYFLCVGLIKSHKNVGVLVDAFLKMKGENEDGRLKLYLVGQADLKQKKVREWLARINGEKNIIIKNNISDDELKQLYRGALAVVVPSLYEGFGFPLIEAMAAETPVIAARSSAIPEVAGEAALYFDPQSPSELKARMNDILDKEELRENLIVAGKKRIHDFDWALAARQTQKVYESVLAL